MRRHSTDQCVEGRSSPHKFLLFTITKTSSSSVQNFEKKNQGKPVKTSHKTFRSHYLRMQVLLGFSSAPNAPKRRSGCRQPTAKERNRPVEPHRTVTKEQRSRGQQMG
jgi:hypothetical protein